MPIVSGGGAAFNGGTITAPLTINSSGGFGVNALSVQGPHTNITLDGDGVYNLKGDDGVNVNVEGTGGTNAQLDVFGDSNKFECVLDSGVGAYLAYAGTIIWKVGQSGGKAVMLTSPPSPLTQAFVSGAGAQISTTRDVHAFTPVTFNPTAGAAATCLVEVSPDGAAYTALWTETEPVGIAFDGTVHGLSVLLPAAWRLRLTVTNATLGTTTYY